MVTQLGQFWVTFSALELGARVSSVEIKWNGRVVVGRRLRFLRKEVDPVIRGDSRTLKIEDGH